MSRGWLGFWAIFSILSILPLGFFLVVTYMAASWLFWVLVGVSLVMCFVYAECMSRLLRPEDYQPYRGKVVYD